MWFFRRTEENYQLNSSSIGTSMKKIDKMSLYNMCIHLSYVFFLLLKPEFVFYFKLERSIKWDFSIHLFRHDHCIVIMSSVNSFGAGLNTNVSIVIHI